VPLTGHLWPLATHHRGHPSGPTGGGEAYGQSGSRTLATPLGAPLRGHSPLWPSGEALHREGAAHRPYWGAGPSLAIGLWATGLPLATYWPSGEGPLATDWPPTPTGHPLRGGHPPLWPLTGHWLHHTGSGATPPAPLGRRGLWPKREPHTTGGGASLWPTGYNPLATPIGEAPLHGQRGAAPPHWPPTAR
jgi:hypothetical protein